MPFLSVKVATSIGPNDAENLTRMSLRHVACTLLPLLAVACSGFAEPEEVATDHHDHDDGVEVVGTTSSALTASSPVSSAVAESCSTTSVKALALQLVQEIQCLKPGSMKRIDNVPGLALGSAVFPYLQTPAADGLIAAQKDRNVTLSINSGLRTLPQQYLLYSWYKTGRCGIGLAAKPGTSNHESGIAVDVSDNSSWRNAMASEGFNWLGSSDPVHFDFKGSGTVNMKGLSVLAFQRLWNRNNPNDKIDEDGAYGPDTESRLAQSPVGGFPVGACTHTLSAPIDPAPGPAEEPLAVPDATEPADDTAAPPSSGSDNTASPLSPSGSRNDANAEGCTVAHGATTHVSYGAPLALAAIGALVARRRRRR